MCKKSLRNLDKLTSDLKSASLNQSDTDYVTPVIKKKFFVGAVLFVPCDMKAQMAHWLQLTSIELFDIRKS